MYIQGKFREDRIEQLHAFMRAHPLASVVMTTAELQAFPMPLELMGNGGNGVLRGHAARKNALSTIPSETKVLVIFQGPNAYISPRWYVSGRDSGQIAPSWNFATVHAVGTLRCIDDVAWVRTHLEALVKSQLATKITNADGSSRYDCRGEDHYHLRDVETGEVRDLPAPFDPDLLAKLDSKLIEELERSGFRVTGYRLEVLGRFEK